MIPLPDSGSIFPSRDKHHEVGSDYPYHECRHRKMDQVMPGMERIRGIDANVKQLNSVCNISSTN